MVVVARSSRFSVIGVAALLEWLQAMPSETNASAFNPCFMALPSLVVPELCRPRLAALRHGAAQQFMRGNGCLCCGNYSDAPWRVMVEQFDGLDRAAGFYRR